MNSDNPALTQAMKIEVDLKTVKEKDKNAAGIFIHRSVPIHHFDPCMQSSIAFAIFVFCVHPCSFSSICRKLSDSVGWSVSAFAQSLLMGQTSPGVWYPEEREALSDRRAFLKLASTGCERFDLNKPAWSFESEVSSFAGLIYW